MADNELSLVYIVEDEPSVGTIADYARALEQAHYSDVSVSSDVWIVDYKFADLTPVLTKVTPTFSESRESDDYRYTTVAIRGFNAEVKIDLRA